MTNKKWPVITIGIINIILVALIILTRYMSDRKPPIIQFGNNDVVYTVDMDESWLYDGVSAADAKDGDVSDRILVEKIVEDRDNSRAIVTYAVSDKSGNVAKQSRVFEAEYAVEDGIEEDTEDAEDADKSGDSEAEEVSAEAELSDESGSEAYSPDAETDDEIESGEDTDGEGYAVTLDSLSEADRNRLKNEVRAELEAETRRAAQAEAARVAAQERAAEKAAEAAEAASTKPSIILKSSSISTTVGTYPAWVNVVGTLSDDKDNYMSLFPTLKYTKFDINTKGTYRVGLTVTDSDGNVSNTAYVNVTVK